MKRDASYIAGLRRAAEIIREKAEMSPSKMRLCAGEMTAQECRTAKALLNMAATAIEREAGDE